MNKIFRRILLAIASLGVAIATIIFSINISRAQMTAACDLAILNGRVMDPETSLDAVLNVCVKDGLIATITPPNALGK